MLMALASEFFVLFPTQFQYANALVSGWGYLDAL